MTQQKTHRFHLFTLTEEYVDESDALVEQLHNFPVYYFSQIRENGSEVTKSELAGMLVSSGVQQYVDKSPQIFGEIVFTNKAVEEMIEKVDCKIYLSVSSRKLGDKFHNLKPVGISISEKKDF